MFFKRIDKIIVTLFSILTLLVTAKSQTQISKVSKTANGLINLHFFLPDELYGVLYRSNSLEETGDPISMINGNNSGVKLSDEIGNLEKGFLRIKTYRKSDSLDIDNDGIPDTTELDALGRMNPLNPAPPISLSSGSQYVPNKEAFNTLSHRDNFPGSKDISEVKFLIFDVHTNSKKLYLINSKRYEYHFTFSRDAVGRYNDNTTFNNHSYFTNTRRRNVAGSIVYHPNHILKNGSKGIYTIEFWPSDPVAFKYVQTAYEMIIAAMPFLRGKVAYHPSSETQRSLYLNETNEYKSSRVTVIDTDELMGNITYNALNTGESYGRLKLISGSQNISFRDIVILENIPNDITHVAGIISEQNQTPLSHINLKAKQNNTPNAFLKNAANDPRVAPFIGKNIQLKIGPDNLEIREASQNELDNYFEKSRPNNITYPKRDLKYVNIRRFANLSYPMFTAYGSKATNLAELKRILPSVTPDGYAIPFYFYHEFMLHNGFYSEATQMINDELFQKFPSVREKRLKEFRKRIKDIGILPGWMLEKLRAMQDSFENGITLRARSSTNNEDLQGFNGAGLYESYSHYPDEGHFSKTAKQVWAGLWTYRAFEEREFWKIDHLTASMGILVHPNYKNELANGVGVTKNIYIPGPGWDGHYINVQKGDDLVTNPSLGSIPEEYIIANLGFGSNYEIQYIRNSNQIPNGERILRRNEALRLKDYMDSIHNHFKGLYRGNSSFAMEIEFKVIEGRKIIIKQARPWVE